MASCRHGVERGSPVTHDKKKVNSDPAGPKKGLIMTEKKKKQFAGDVFKLGP